MTTEQKVIKGFAYFLAGFIILSIISLVVNGISMLMVFDDNGEYIKDEEVDMSDYANITKLDITLKSISLEIITGDKFSVEKYNLKNDVTIKSSGNTLKIDEREQFWFWNAGNGKIIVTVPKRVELKDLKVDIGAGKVSIDDIVAYRLELDQGAGTTSLENCTFDEVDIDGGAGKLVIEDSTFKNLDLDCGVGTVDFSGKLLGKSKIDAGVGSLNIDLKGSRNDYTLDIEKGIGSIKVDGNSMSGRIGDGVNKIEIDGGVGSININFK